LDEIDAIAQKKVRDALWAGIFDTIYDTGKEGDKGEKHATITFTKKELKELASWVYAYNNFETLRWEQTLGAQRKQNS